MSAATLTGRRPPLASGAFVGTLLGVAVVLGVLEAVSPELAFAGALLASFVAAALLRPELVTLLVVFLMYLNVPATAVNEHGAPAMIAAGVPLLLALPLAQHLIRGGKMVINPTFVLVLLLLVVQLLSTIFSEHQSLGVEKLKTFTVEGVLLYLLVLNAVRSRERLEQVMWMVLLAAAALSMITIWQKVTGDWARPFGGFGKVDAAYFTGRGTSPRASGPLGDPNYYAQILLVALPLGLVTIFRARSTPLRVVAIGATSVTFVAMMITNSRGAALGLLVVLLTMFLLGMMRPRHVVPVVLALVLLVSLVPEYKDRVATLSSVSSAASEAGTDPEADQSAQSRTAEMLAAGMVFLDHPLLGVGPTAFPRYYQEYAQRLGLPIHETTESGAREGLEAERQSHNIFMTVAADLGLIGLLVFCAIIFMSARELLRARKYARRTDPEAASLATAFLLALVAYVSTGLFLTLAFERYFWLLLGLAGAAALVARGEAAAASQRRSRRPTPVPERVSQAEASDPAQAVPSG